MPKILLTDMTVQKLPEGLYFDTKVPSFGIRVGAHRRTWIVVKGENRTKVKLGGYPSLSLQEARRKAMAAVIAPAESRKGKITFRDAKAAFLAEGQWRPQTKRVLVSNLRHFEWQKSLSKISLVDVVEVLDGIVGESARWHARKDIGTFFNWCVPRYLDHSPTQGIKSRKQPSRERVLSDDELCSVWLAAVEMGYPFGNLVRLLILKGQRCGEIGHLHSTFIEDDRFYLPPSVTKNGREHWVPLTAYDQGLLPKVQGFLFPNSLGEAFSSFSLNHRRLLKLSATAGWTLHDLRRTFATGLARQGTPIHVTEKILNHVSGSLSGVAGIYNRFEYWEERAEALRLWEDHVLKLVE